MPSDPEPTPPPAQPVGGSPPGDTDPAAACPAALLQAGLPAQPGRAAVCWRELGAGDLPRLQAFFDANPAYFQAVTGQPAAADEARQVLDERPPREMGWSGRWLLGLDVPGAPDRVGPPPLLAMVELVRDLLAPGVWHIGLLIVATARHGHGDARQLMLGLRQAVAAAGGRWLRLGVVVGNTRAERFWHRQGFVELRQRVSDVGGQPQVVRVMAQPLAPAGARATTAEGPDGAPSGGTDRAPEDAGWVATYLAAVPRDRPEPGAPPGAQPDAQPDPAPVHTR